MMVDAALLRSLGWSEELIQEVTRKAESLNVSLPDFTAPTTPSVDHVTVQTNQIRFEGRAGSQAATALVVSATPHLSI